MTRREHILPRCLVTVAVLFLAAAAVARGDAIVVTKAMTASTIAEIFIDEEVIRVELEIGAQDLPSFHNLMPDSVNEGLGFEAEPLAVRLPRFFSQDFAFRPDGGDPLPGRVVEIGPRPRVARDELTGESLPPAEGEQEQVLFTVLEYPLSSRPASLTIEAMGSGVPLASIGFVAYHDDLPLNDFRYLSGEQTIDFDWEDPWYSKFRIRNLWRQYDAPLSAFLYVEPFEVRVEIIARPVDVQRWQDLGLEGAEVISVDQQPSIKQQVADFFPQHFALTVDGEVVTPELDRVHFLNRTLRTSTVIDPPIELDAVAATLGIIYVLPTEGLPQEAELEWQLFSDRIPTVRGAATDEAGALPMVLQAEDPILWWRNFLKNPTLPTLVDIVAPPGLLARSAIWLAVLFGALGVGLLLRARRAADTAGATRFVLPILLIAVAIALAAWRPGRVDAAATEEILAGLLHNVYRAFDYRDESTIYDVLDRSVTGDLLTQTYLETRRGLELQSQGGARAKVQDIELLEVVSERLTGRPGFTARSTWNVSGSVGHWGHVHTRSNQYEADFTIEPVDGTWKITGMTLLQEERI